MLHKVLRLPEVISATGLSRSVIYAKMSEKAFPAPITLATRAVGWIESDIAAWQEARIAERDASRKPSA
jgi:prophage regulatory protein